MSTKIVIPLENIDIATPCQADWNLMQGDDRVRFCQSCAKNVYNLSAMNKKEAEALIAQKEGDLCARYSQRADGTIITDNCPIPVRFVRRPFRWLVTGLTALLASSVAWCSSAKPAPEKSTPLKPAGQADGTTDTSPRKFRRMGYITYRRVDPQSPKKKLPENKSLR